tara:strand:+ start:1641 stop:2570 length:930 start_codon:yes stop_codon:yes gene_type:complete
MAKPTLHEIRETIMQTGTPDENGLVQIQKRINLRAGVAHTIQHIDFFDDGLLGATNIGNDFSYQVWLTNYPVIITDDIFHAGQMRMGPMAGDDNVLYKAVQLSFGPQGLRNFEEFPNAFLGSQPTFEFFTPHIYFTMVTMANELVAPPAPNVKMSIYLAILETEVEAVEYGIGVLQEWTNNQAMLLRKNGRQVDRLDVIGAQPMWQIGGIRPEFMASNDTNILGENWFFNQAGYGGAEAMSLTTSVRGGLAAARKMVGFGDAFGSESGGKAIPDWFKAIAKPFPGLESGPIRSQEPPLKHFDNGNVEML